jgi:hypothetical protein
MRPELVTVGEYGVVRQVRDHAGDEAGRGDRRDADEQREGRPGRGDVLDVRMLHEHDGEAGEGRVDAFLQCLGALILRPITAPAATGFPCGCLLHARHGTSAVPRRDVRSGRIEA